MADVKISALPASTTPLAGTEVLPIVQSSTTKQVSVANLTAGRAVSALSIATTTGATFATTSGSVGIGQSSPTAKLDILNSNATYSLSQKVFNASAGTFFLGQSPSATFLSVDNFAMAFCTGSDGGVAGTSVPTNERMRLPAAGGVQAVTTISVGNATPSASGAGITFPATESASNDANTLDDYEEGTFTPILGTTGGGTATMSLQEGKYIKVGKIVQFSLQIAWTAKNTWSFNTRISGLPFTATTNTGGYVWPNACQMDANALTVLFIYGIESNSTYGYVQAINVSGAQLTETSFPASGRVVVNGCYQTT